MKHIAEWIVVARDIATQCRLGLTLEAGAAMVDFLPSMTKDVKALIDHDFLQLVSDLDNCQKRCDWLGLADSLEFELVQWFRRLDAISK